MVLEQIANLSVDENRLLGSSPSHSAKTCRLISDYPDPGDEKCGDTHGWFEQEPTPGDGDGKSAPAKAAV